MNFINLLRAILLLSVILSLVGCEKEDDGTIPIVLDSKTGKLTVDVYKAGNIEPYFEKNKIDVFSLKTIVVKGNLNGKDVLYLRKLTSTHGMVEILDFTDAHLLENAFPDKAFSSSRYLKKVIFPRDLKYSGISLLNRSESIEEVLLNEDIEVLESFALSGNNFQTIHIPQSVKIIGDGALSSSKKIESIDLPQGLDSLGASAFHFCESLKEVTIPDKIKNISDALFSHCTSLSKVNLPEGLESIGKGAFSGCQSLKEIAIPNNVRYIGGEAFSYMPKFTSLKLPSGLQILDVMALSSLSNIESIVIPCNVRYLGDNQFVNSKNLRSISLPESVEYIGQLSFTNLPALEEIHVKWKIPIADNGCFETLIVNEDNKFIGIDKTKVKLYVPKGTIAAYRNTKVWQDFRIIIEE